MVGVCVHKYGRQIVAVLLILCIMPFFSQPTLGAASDDTGYYDTILQSHEIILLLDTSASMSWSDAAFLAPDTLRQITGSLPSYWHVGLVTFNSDVVDVVPPGADTRAEIHTALQAVQYTGYANAGAGLLQAAGLFSDHALSRTMVFLTDGQSGQTPETDIPEDVMQLKDQAIAQIATTDIQVHTIAVDYGAADSHSGILGLALATGGHLFRELRSEDLSRIASTLSFGIFGIARNPQMRDAAGGFLVRLPTMGLDAVRVLITAESAIEYVIVVDGDSGSYVDVQAGKRFALVEVLNPTSQTIRIDLVTAGSSSADLVVEWDLRLMEERPDGGLARFWLADNDGENVFLNSFFSETFFPIFCTEGVLLQTCAEAGHLHWGVEAEEASFVLQAYLGAFGINIPDSVEKQVAVPAPPVEPLPTAPPVIDDPVDIFEEEPPSPIIDNMIDDIDVAESEHGFVVPILAGVCALLVIALLLYLRYFRRQPVETAQTEQEGERELVFTGKMDLYVIIGSDDPGAPNRTVRLPRRGQDRERSLKEILQKCRLSDTFPGSEHVFFSADKQGALQVLNTSNCTIFAGSDMLVKGEQYTLRHKENVRIRDIYGTSELVISPRFLYQTS